MKQPNIAVYGSRTCEDTIRTTRFLDDHQIPYEFKDVDESPEYNSYIASLNAGKRVTPTIRIDNETFVNPSEEELGRAIEAAASAR
ncbi:MAG: glutaredoxin family protein [Isosphaeraceae bacterium]|nr:glutaredoxin family protein [Isosphaeraceae bacterium]